MRYYDYDRKQDHVVLDALLKTWKAPAWAQAYAPNHEGKMSGNCIPAARFAHGVLDLLHVHCDLAAVRVRSRLGKYGVSIGWGDCGSYMEKSERGFPGHAVVIGHDWLFDAAAEQSNADGPVVAEMTGPGQWSTTGIEYTWAPGLRQEISNQQEWGWKAPAQRLARDVRKVAGPCRKPRSFDPNGTW